MNRSSPQLAVLALRWRLASVLACIGFLLPGTSANAGTVLQFAQINPFDKITATNNGAGVTTLSTAGNADGGGLSVPVRITNYMGVSGFNIPVFETFVGVTSTAPVFSVAGSEYQSLTGTIEFTSAPGGLGFNYLTVALGSSGNYLSGVVGGGAATLIGGQPPGSLTFTATGSPLIAPTAMSISFSNVSPAFGITGNSISSFTAQNAGTFSAVVPEPASMALMGLGMSGLLAFRRFLRRRKMVVSSEGRSGKTF